MSNNDSEKDLVSFEPKFLISWCLWGIPIAIFVTIVNISTGQPQNILIGIIASPIVAVIYGGFLLIMDAGFNYRFNIMRVKNQVWYWHIYPLAAIFVIIFTICKVIIKMALRG
jgi:hypothetical protein